jgi:hypothetical protein
MSIVRSDNRKEEHPKPVQEYERRFTGVTWVDWADFAEMEAVYNVAYRLNKYFWVAGTYYQCYGTSLYRAISSGGSGVGNCFILAIMPDASANTIDVPALDGKTFRVAITNSQSFDTVLIAQTGTELDFTLVGGVQLGVLITILYE